MYIKRTPLLTTWLITARCQSKCIYCDYWREKNSPELDFKHIEKIINELKQAGTQIIHFTGGEPLTRNDIDKILYTCSQKQIKTSLNTNCILFPEKFTTIKNSLNVLKISLDGPKPIHEKIRGVKCFDNLINTIELVKKTKIKIAATTVINTLNHEYIEDLLALAKNLEIPLSFQFASPFKFKSNKINPFSLNKIQYNETINKLINLKNKPLGKYISNSLPALEYMKNPRSWKCFMQRISLKIDNYGNLDLCGVKPFPKENFNCVKEGFSAAYKKMKYELTCSYPCWCAARVETNLLVSLSPKVILNHLIKYANI
jgi:MoaA/NifB/PqqE/SkfB family radical SAM enzyme